MPVTEIAPDIETDDELVVRPSRKLAAPSSTLKPASEAGATNVVPADSSVTSPVVLMFVAPADAIRSPMILMLPVALPPVNAPKSLVIEATDVVTPSVPPSSVIEPVEARMSPPYQ